MSRQNTTVDDLVILDKFQHIEGLPDLTEEQHAGLEENIKADGKITDSLIWWMRQGTPTLVDGHHRLGIWKSLIIQGENVPRPSLIRMDFETDAHAILWVIRRHLEQRNMTTKQQAAAKKTAIKYAAEIAVPVVKDARQRKKDGQKKGAPMGTPAREATLVDTAPTRVRESPPIDSAELVIAEVKDKTGIQLTHKDARKVTQEANKEIDKEEGIYKMNATELKQLAKECKKAEELIAEHLKLTGKPLTRAVARKVFKEVHQKTSKVAETKRLRLYEDMKYLSTYLASMMPQIERVLDNVNGLFRRLPTPPSKRKQGGPNHTEMKNFGGYNRIEFFLAIVDAAPLLAQWKVTEDMEIVKRDGEEMRVLERIRREADKKVRCLKGQNMAMFDFAEAKHFVDFIVNELRHVEPKK